jgi:hypothetical protein
MLIGLLLESCWAVVVAMKEVLWQVVLESPSPAQGALERAAVVEQHWGVQLPQHPRVGSLMQPEILG